MRFRADNLYEGENIPLETVRNEKSCVNLGRGVIPQATALTYIKLLNLRERFGMKKFTLGQEVVFSGRLRKKFVSRNAVEEMKHEILATGQPVASQKYKVIPFGTVKRGIVVGMRSIVGSRLHYLDTTFGRPTVETKTMRQPAVIVATDLRGLCYVPLDMVMDYEEYESVDFDDFDDEFDFDDDDLEEFDEEDIA